ncbi:hypothetical protein, partial [Lentzea sp. NPDC060358]|uniref:hypothetical protein n=1 Tax=Lentzea sp. NPDC060358 TaxID=3347103 RepID=UPI00364FA37F
MSNRVTRRPVMLGRSAVRAARTNAARSERDRGRLDHHRAGGLARLRFGVHSGQQCASFAEGLELWQLAEEPRYDWCSLVEVRTPGRDRGVGTGPDQQRSGP